MTCEHCGQIHAYAGCCQKIKAIEYYENGTIKRIEYMTMADYCIPRLPNPYPPAYPQYPTTTW